MIIGNIRPRPDEATEFLKAWGVEDKKIDGYKLSEILFRFAHVYTNKERKCFNFYAEKWGMAQKQGHKSVKQMIYAVFYKNNRIIDVAEFFSMGKDGTRLMLRKLGVKLGRHGGNRQTSRRLKEQAAESGKTIDQYFTDLFTLHKTGRKVSQASGFAESTISQYKKKLGL